MQASGSDAATSLRQERFYQSPSSDSLIAGKSGSLRHCGLQRPHVRARIALLGPQQAAS